MGDGGMFGGEEVKKREGGWGKKKKNCRCTWGVGKEKKKKKKKGREGGISYGNREGEKNRMGKEGILGVVKKINK